MPKKFNMKYIREDIPKFKVPSVKGNCYEDMIPDTLDVQERIKIAVNGLTGPTDPDKDYLLYFGVNFRANPPSMFHGHADMCQTKFMESLPLMRIASGSKLNNQIDPVWMATALHMIGPDGLFYWYPYPWIENIWITGKLSGRHFSIPSMCGRMIGAMTIYHLRDPSGPWEKEIHKVIKGLWDIAIIKEDYAYFPQGVFIPTETRVKKAAVPTGIHASLVGWTIHGLAQFHRATGYKPAEDLAGKLSRYLIYHGLYFGPNGEFLPHDPGLPFHPSEDKRSPTKKDEQGVDLGVPQEYNPIHFQHHMVPLLGVLDHAVAVGDKKLCDFVCKSFEWAKTKGNIIVGFFPENIDNIDEMETSELCEVAGMIGLAIKLSAAGLGDYWDDADRWIRNQFAEGQLLKPEWVYQICSGNLITKRTDQIPLSAIDPISETCDHVPERNVGAFAGYPTPNNWYEGHGREKIAGIMHCCTGNSTRALYYIWEHILTFENGILSVNLLLNKPSEWMDIHSYIPYEGQVDLLIKKECSLRVRIPEWVKPVDAKCMINNKPHKVSWQGRYALIRKVVEKDKVVLTFPISERIVEVNIEKQRYTLILKGNEVVNIYPPGHISPLYKREHYRDNTVHWRKANRFISKEENIKW